jgi:2-polyprenyl-3-methyl-5-hydroxy-6-metoxy-1,4-benzoquinol methylase
MHLPYCYQGRRTFIEIFANENPELLNNQIGETEKDKVKALTKSPEFLTLVNEKIYPSEIASGQIGNIWKKHHETFAEFIAKWEPKNICEIGGGHGYLAKIILDENSEIKYLMIEPDPSTFDERVEYLKDFVENNLDKISSYDHIIHSHVLEHIYDPINFLKQIAAKMKPEAKMHISIPNIEEIINTKTKYGNTNK